MKFYKAILLCLLFVLSACKSKNSISNYVEYEQFYHEFKKELTYKCINKYATGYLKDEIVSENKTEPYYYPPPPFYIKQFSLLQDSIVNSKQINGRVLYDCMNNFDKKDIDKLIKQKYKEKALNNNIEGNDGY